VRICLYVFLEIWPPVVGLFVALQCNQRDEVDHIGRPPVLVSVGPPYPAVYRQFALRSTSLSVDIPEFSNIFCSLANLMQLHISSYVVISDIRRTTLSADR